MSALLLPLVLGLVSALVAWRLDHVDLRRVTRQRDRLWQARRTDSLAAQRLRADLARVTRERDDLQRAIDAVAYLPAETWDAAVLRHPAGRLRAVDGGA